MLVNPNDRLKEMGITLPAPCLPAGNYRPARIVGKYLYVSGHTPNDANPNCAFGKVTGKFGEKKNPPPTPAPAPCDPQPRSGYLVGKVKWYNPIKGYGFVTPRDGTKDVFLHVSAVERAGLSTLNEGQIIEFRIVSNRGKTSAEDLRVVGSNYTPPPPPPPPPVQKPGTVTPEQGYAAARDVALAVLSTVQHAVGDLSRVQRIVKATGLVNCTDDFVDHPKVMNGFSDLMAKVFGEENGIGTRSATGASSLPDGVPVEVTECIFELKPAVRAAK